MTTTDTDQGGPRRAENPTPSSARDLLRREPRPCRRHPDRRRSHRATICPSAGASARSRRQPPTSRLPVGDTLSRAPEAPRTSPRAGALRARPAETHLPGDVDVGASGVKRLSYPSSARRCARPSTADRRVPLTPISVSEQYELSQAQQKKKKNAYCLLIGVRGTRRSAVDGLAQRRADDGYESLFMLEAQHPRRPAGGLQLNPARRAPALGDVRVLRGAAQGSRTGRAVVLSLANEQRLQRSGRSSLDRSFAHQGVDGTADA